MANNDISQSLIWDERYAGVPDGSSIPSSDHGTLLRQLRQDFAQYRL